MPYILVIVLLLFFGRDRSRKGGTVAEDTPRPDHREGLPTWRRLLPWTIFIVALIAYSQAWINVGWLQADAFDQSVVAQSLVMGIIFLSFVVVTGLGGMVSLAQATFVTAGGFAAGWALTWQTGMNIPGISTHGQINFLWAALFGALVAAALGALIAMLATRLGGVMLALGTLAAAFISASVVFEIDDVRNHSDLGWTIRSPTLDIPGLNWVNNLIVKGDQPKIDFSQVPEQILLFLAVFGIITLIIHALYRSSSGRAMLATRSSEVAAQASGIRVNRTKVLVFTFSAGIAGFGGVMLGLFNFSIGGANPSYDARVRRIVLARARGDVRHPPTRRRAPRRLCVRGGNHDLPLVRDRRPAADLRLVRCHARRRREHAAHLRVLHPDPVRSRRDQPRPGARRHPLARRPAAARQAA